MFFEGFFLLLGIRPYSCPRSAKLRQEVPDVQIIPQVELAAAEAEAMARVGKRDPADWPALVGALQFDCPVWTEDEDFFGSGVATWTTATVEFFCAESDRAARPVRATSPAGYDPRTRGSQARFGVYHGVPG